MRAIHRKLFRDLWEIKGQVVAIASVIGIGIAMFIAYLSTFDSLQRTQEAFYDRYRFGEVFASLKRAPTSLTGRIAEIPGVAQVQTRVVADVTLDVEGMSEPVTGRLVSVPESRTPMLNDLALRKGRYLEPGRSDEVVISEGFATAHELLPGDSLVALINGSRRRLDIVGIALSPEFTYTIRPGDLVPDDSRFGIVWMGHKALATAFDMEGGFNDLSLQLSQGATTAEVIARLDRLLEPYGGLGAIPRDLQISHWYLNNELNQLQGFGVMIPFIFMSVAVFLLNVVLSRIISVQREQIAALKALGYQNHEVGWHYGLWSLSISALGGGFGVALGRVLGGGMLSLYNDYFRFPFLEQNLSLQVVLGAVSISLAAAVLGSVRSVRQAVQLPPAEAMRPEPPARYRRTLVERLGLEKLLSQPARIVLRNLERQPLRALASIAGIAASGGLLVIGLFMLDSIEVILDQQFFVSQRQDITVSFVEPRSAAALHEIHRLPGVLSAEPARNLSVRLRAGHRSRQTGVTGLVGEPRLQRVVDSGDAVRSLPPDGILMTSMLAEVLGVERGSEVILEVLEGARPARRAQVVDLVDQYVGTAIYMDIDALRRLMREGPVLTGAYLQIDSRAAVELYQDLKDLPSVAGVAIKKAAVETMQAQLDQSMGVLILFNILFASIITVGVVYNAARIALSERSRELASLRVLGFTRAEISFILLGELAVLTALAIPVGMLVGRGLAALLTASVRSELFRFPLIVSVPTYALTALVVLGASALSGFLVRRQLDHLDLVEVLKTRE
ncbi:MAG: FtsX-like permease family protein [Acidobacteriota bacterium]